MIATLRAYLAKERRDGRALLIGIPTVITVALVMGAILMPRRFLEDPFFPQIAAAACLALGLLAVAGEVVPGEARRGRMGFLARLPGGLGTAYAAKAIHVVLTLALLTAFGLVAGKLVAAAWGVPFSIGNTELWRHLRAPRYWFWRSGVGPALLLMVAGGGWILVVSTWLPRGSLTLPATALALGAFGVPLWLIYGTAPGLEPYPGFTWTLMIALTVAPWAIGWLCFARGRRHGRGAWSSAWRGLVAMLVLFLPAWSFAAFEARDYHTVDPASDRFRIAGGYVGEGGRHLYLNVGMVRRFRDDTKPPGFRRPLGPRFPIVVDLESGDWRLLGDPGDVFAAWGTQRLHPTRLISVLDTSASSRSREGRETWRRWHDGATAEMVKSGWDHVEHAELAAYGRRRADDVPEGYRSCTRWGLGWSAFRDRKRWLWDPFRGKAFGADSFKDWCWVRIRPGRWLAHGPWSAPRGTRRQWVLLDPETTEVRPLGGPSRTHVLSLASDGRALISIFSEERKTTRLRLVDPETMEGFDLADGLDGVSTRGRTPDGAELLVISRTDGWRFARLDLETGEITDFGGPQDVGDLHPVAVLDEETLIAIHDRRRVVRLRRGSDEMEVLFPRGEDE